MADAYLFAVLNWSAVTPVNLEAWPALRAYPVSLLARPRVQRTFAEEREGYARRHAS